MKNFVNTVLILCGVFSSKTYASDVQVDVTTPRGSLIKLDIYNPGLKSVLLLGPGQGCVPRLDMYDAIAAEAKGKGFTVVRLYWAYCVADPKNGNPSDDLSTEKDDFTTALNYVRSDLKFTDANIFIGGKSLGTFVSFEVFVSQKNLRALLMLTPVCTDSQTDQKNHKNIFVENYPGLETETRPILLAQGNMDPLCDTNHFQDYLKNKGTNFVPVVVKGNHGFGIQNPDGQYDTELNIKNLQAISKWIFTWIN